MDTPTHLWYYWQPWKPHQTEGISVVEFQEISLPPPQRVNGNSKRGPCVVCVCGCGGGGEVFKGEYGANLESLEGWGVGVGNQRPTVGMGRGNYGYFLEPHNNTPGVYLHATSSTSNKLVFAMIKHHTQHRVHFSWHWKHLMKIKVEHLQTDKHTAVIRRQSE